MMAKRIAIAAAVLLLLGAVAATFLPTSPNGATCGTWISPEWGEKETDELVESTRGLVEQSLSDELAAEAYAIAAGARESQRVCSDALSTRRTISLVLLGLAVLVPVGVMFIAGGRRETA